MTQPEQKSLAYAWFMLCAARSQARARGITNADGCKIWKERVAVWLDAIQKAGLGYTTSSYPVLTYTLSDGRVFKDGEAL